MSAQPSERILVTGASGLLGFSVLTAAVERGIDSIGVYHQHPIRHSSGATVQANLEDRRAVRALMADTRPTWVIHCAAFTQVDEAEKCPERAAKTNVDASRFLAAAAREFGARMLYVSTDSVFDGQRSGYTEEDAPAPIHAYGRTKLAGELAVQTELADALIVRTCIYGWSPQEKPSLAQWLLRRLESFEVTPGFTDVTFSPIFAGDLSEVMIEMLHLGFTGLYHVAGAESCTKHDFAVRLACAFGLDPALIRRCTLAEAALTAPRPRNTSLCVEKISRALVQTLPDVEKGLHHFKARRALAGRSTHHKPNSIPCPS